MRKKSLPRAAGTLAREDLVLFEFADIAKEAWGGWCRAASSLKMAAPHRLETTR
jgi:hypothetical protein